MESFSEALNTHFPGAVSETVYVSSTYSALLSYGFHRSNSIACVAVCRDEITRPFVKEIESTWGNSFNLAGLAGLIFAGKTGFGAAHHHAPNIDGRERYLYFAFPHIALGPQGEIGVCTRFNRQGASGACGALQAFYKELTSQQVRLEIDPNDVEQSLLRMRLSPGLKGAAPADLVGLTRYVYDVILDDLERTIAATVHPDHADYAVFAGIQVHGPDERNYVWPGVAYAVVKGKRTELKL